MKYSNQATVDYAAKIDKENCLRLFSTLIIKEGYKGKVTEFKADQMVLDMDCVEVAIASTEKRAPHKSMDSAFVAQDLNGAKNEVVFVEYRFNYKSMKNLDKGALYGKVRGSRAVIGNIFQIHGKYYFVFDSNMKQQAIRHLYSINPKMPQHYVAVDIEDIKTLFF